MVVPTPTPPPDSAAAAQCIAASQRHYQRLSTLPATSAERQHPMIQSAASSEFLEQGTLQPTN